MSMQNIQAIAVPLYLSTDGVNWKILVCLADHTLPLTMQTTDTNTQCGVAVGTGPVKFAPTFSAVANTNPDPGQVGVDDMEGWMLNNTLLYYKFLRPAAGQYGYGGNKGISGRVLVTAVTETLTVDDVVKFSGTLSGVGQPSQITS